MSAHPRLSLRGLVREARHRGVLRVALWYAAGAWLAIEVAATVFPLLNLPDWAARFVVFAAGFGFFVAVVISWVFDLTPDGLRRTAPTESEAAPPHAVVRWGVLPALLIAAVLSSAWLARRVVEPDSHPVAAHEVALDPARIAVLYFEDQTPGEELSFLAAGITEGLIHELSQVETIRVLSRNAVRPFRGVPVGLDSIARALGTGTIVEGTVTRVGGRLRVRVQLTDGGTAEHLHSRTIERPASDILELQDEITIELSQLLRRRLGGQLRLQERQAATRNAEAWELTRRADQELDTFRSLYASGDEAGARDTFARTDTLLSQAQRLDRGWVEPVVQRAWLRAAVGQSTTGALTAPTTDRLQVLAAYEQGLRFAEEALGIDPASAEALEVRGDLRFRISMLELKSPEESNTLRALAEADLRAALDRAPNHARAMSTLGALLYRAGDIDGARLWVERAYEKDAYLENAQQILFMLVQTSLTLRRSAEAIAWSNEGRRRFPDDFMFPTAALVTLAAAPDVPADPDYAWQLADETYATAPPDQRSFNRAKADILVASVLARAALDDSARAVVVRAAAQGRAHDPAHRLRYYEAPVWILLGEHETAIECLADYLAAFPARKAEVARDWWMEALWEHPRFRALVAPAVPG